MNKYKDYIGRMQQDRILLDILRALDEINEQLKTTKVTTPLPKEEVKNVVTQQVGVNETPKAKTTKTTSKTSTTKVATKSTTAKRGTK